MGITQFVDAGTLAAATPTVLTYNVREAKKVFVVIANTGVTNAIDTPPKIEVAPQGGNYVTAFVPIGAIPAGIKRGFPLDVDGIESVKVTLTSTSGTTYATEIRGQ